MATYTMKIYNDSFYGNKISEYGLQNGYVDYATLAGSFNLILNNDIIPNTRDIGYWECVNGSEYDEETDEFTEIYQYYIFLKLVLKHCSV